jgi:hypothetical protein
MLLKRWPMLGWLALALPCLGCSSSPRRESLAHGRFERLELSLPDVARSVVLVLSEPAHAARTSSLVTTLERDGALVTPGTSTTWHTSFRRIRSCRATSQRCWLAWVAALAWLPPL